ncbi:STAS-like domain-containing protein [Heyndrickxia oleronia]|nr:STAS-like domain-containing protein [Heyndrickxia oleronia]MEC1373395.1 STAS-like domain-containing protein [Heyndrickxia oleronia]QQZ04309.1 STAS-like domain-containing protein [Heyndrickxia oleronia]
MNKIYVKDIINSRIAVSPEKGETLYKFIVNELSTKKPFYLSFSDVEDTTTAFLNKAIGNLYNNFSSEELNKYLSIIDLDDLDKYLLKKVITRAKVDIKNISEIDEVLENE